MNSSLITTNLEVHPGWIRQSHARSRWGLKSLSSECSHISDKSMKDWQSSCPTNGWIRDLTLDGIEPNPGPKITNNKRRNRKRRPQTPQERYQPTIGPVTSIDVQAIMPARKLAVLKYSDSSTVRNNPGGTFLVYSMRINDLFDPDPLILSGSVSNFKEMMQFYSYYRVLYSRIIWTVVNLETFPITCGIVLSQTNLTGTIATLADAQNAFENDYATRLHLLSGKGGIDRKAVNTPKYSVGHVLGVPAQYHADLAYAGNGIATPAIPLWANFIVYSATGGALANGYANNTMLEFETEFFGRLNNRS